MIVRNVNSAKKIIFLTKKQERNIPFTLAPKGMIQTWITSVRISRNTSRENIEKKIQSVINANILKLALTRAMLLIVKQSLIQEAITYVAEWGVSKMNNCNFTTCRYNADGKCANDEKKKECIDVCEKVLCIDKKTFRKIDNVKHIGDDDGEPIETSEFHDMTIGIDVSVDAVNEYAKSILGRYPKNNYEFSRALAMKILEETKSLANNEKKE